MADWKAQLGDLFKKQAEEKAVADDQTSERRQAAAVWFKEVAVPAYNELKIELEKHGRTVAVSGSDRGASIEVARNGNLELRHSLEALVGPSRAYIKLKGRQTDKSDGKQFGWESQLLGSSEDCVIEKLTKDHLISKFMEDYTRVVGDR